MICIMQFFGKFLARSLVFFMELDELVMSVKCLQDISTK